MLMFLLWVIRIILVLIWVDKNENIKTYVNCGDWVYNCTYVIIKDKQVRLRKWESQLNVEDI